jgi:2-methylcitrate dehydratase PrpD
VVSYEELTGDVVELCRHALLDWLGVTLGGSQEELTGILLDTLAPARASHRDAVTVVGHGARYLPLQAALINGSASHALDFDDFNAAHLGHFSVAVLGAALALAEQQDARVAELLAAFIAGYDTACRIAVAIGPQPYLRGFHQTSTVGTFGAAAASARLLRLDARATATALGVAASQSAGARCNFGTMTKPLHAGKACESGLLAALLASKGFSASLAAIEADKGFAALCGGTCDVDAATAALAPGEALRENLFKYHASCFMTHSMLEGITGLLSAGEFRAEQVERVDVHVSHVEMGTCAIPEPATGLEVKFSLAHMAAMALLGRPTTEISDAHATDPELIAMRAKVTVYGDAQPGAPTRVEVNTATGVHHAEKDVSAPEPDLSLQADRLAGKFRILATPVLGTQPAEELLDAVRRLEPDCGVRQLMALTRPSTAHRLH